MNPTIMPYAAKRIEVVASLPLFVSARSVFADARDDMSAHLLQQFLEAGFREVEWRYGFEAWQNTELWRQMGSVCPVCFALDGQRFKIEWLLQNMRHNAPKYTMSHVNCECQLFRINRTEEMLDYSEKVDLAPGDIADQFKSGPIDLDQVPADQRSPMGLPPDVNEWTDIQWQFDPTRNEFVPVETLQKEHGESGQSGEWVFDAQAGEFVRKGA